MKNAVEIERLPASLRRAEKAELLRWVAKISATHTFRDLNYARHLWWRRLHHQTRIPVRLLENSRRLGTPEAEILRVYPQLRAEDLAPGYLRSHRDEIDHEIKQNEAA